ncbi:hypothetical protein HDV05_004092 [Chytridiales sp. JEL 0842]|nr:hypothetical protein HDV05_004092 [Chytridiales sp. JEL 0842]
MPPSPPLHPSHPRYLPPSSDSGSDEDSSDDALTILSPATPVTPEGQQTKDEDKDRLPWVKVITISSVLFVNSYLTTTIIPFVPFLIEEYFHFPKQDVGRFSGLILASYMCGQMLFSYPVGLLSDIVGRRPTLILGLVGSSVCTIAFGFAPTFLIALMFRFICGSLNGIVSITKSMTSEVSTPANQALAFSILGTARAIGLIAGPAVGGFLSQPSKKYPSYFPEGSLFDRYPYALPCVFGSLVAFIGFVAAYFILEETMPMKTNASSASSASSTLPTSSSKASTTPSPTALSTTCSSTSSSTLTTFKQPIHFSSKKKTWKSYIPFTSSSKPTNRTRKTDEERPHITYLSDSDSEEDETLPLLRSHNNQSKNEQQESSIGLGLSNTPVPPPNPPKVGPDPLLELLQNKKIYLNIILYAAVSALYIQYDELLALQTRLAPPRGLDFTTSDIGMIFSYGGISLFVYQFFLFTPLEKRLGALKGFRYGLLSTIPAFILLPNIPSLQMGEVGVWVLVVGCQILRTCGALQALTCSFIMTSNCVETRSRGSVNGITQSIGAAARMVAPIIAGNLFSWGLSNSLPHPFDHRFSFYQMALVASLVYIISFWMPADVNQRVEEEVVNEDK